MTPQEELAALRRLAALEAKASGVADIVARNPSQEDPGFLANLTAALGRGATLGASEYARAAGGTVGDVATDIIHNKPVNMGDVWVKNRRQISGERKAFGEKFPVAATAAELAGGLAVPLPIPKAAGFWGRVGEGAATGAGVGGISGAINAEGGIPERAEGALAGAGLGAGIGAGLPMLTGAASVAAAPFVNRLTDPATVANMRLGRELSEGGMTPENVAANLRKLGPGSMMLDAGGDAVTGLAESIAQQPGQGRAVIKQALDARRAQAPAVAWSAVNRGLKPDDFAEASEKFVSTLRQNADAMYGEVRQKVPYVWSEDLGEMFKRPTIREALGTAMKHAADEGRPFGIIRKDGKFATAEDFEKGDGIKALTFDALQDIKKVLDAKIDAEANELTGRLTAEGRRLMGLKDMVIKAADKSDPSGLWAKARAQYAGDAEVVSALRAGRSVLRDDPVELRSSINAMSAAEKDAFRTGAAEAIRQKMASAGDNANAVRGIVGSPLLRERLRPLFDREGEYLKFVSGLQGVGKQQENTNRIMSGAQTAYRTAMRESDTGPVGAAAENAAAATRGLFPWIANTGKQALNWAAAPREDVRHELARLLVQSNPAAVQRSLWMLDAGQEAARAQALKRMALERQAMAAGTGAAVPSMFGGQAGRGMFD